MALIMQCVSLFLQFLWATGLLLASNLALAVRHLHLKQISCGNLTDYFSHFRFPWSWSPFSTCSSGPSAPCMVRPLWLVCWFHLRSSELLELLSSALPLSLQRQRSSADFISGPLSYLSCCLARALPLSLQRQHLKPISCGLPLSLQRQHLKPISCGYLKTDYFPHFSNFLVLWTPFTTCSSGLSVPLMARLLGLSVVLTRASVPSLQS